jgi:hypothetical protein
MSWTPLLVNFKLANPGVKPLMLYFNVNQLLNHRIAWPQELARVEAVRLARAAR